MARPYSQKFLLELYGNTSDGLGVQLAKLCVKANLPATYVAVACETTRTSIYSWFRGQGIREKKHNLVKSFIALVESDMANGVLPAKSTEEAKKYIEAMLGVTL
ncbi:hypothetical protein EBT31_21235 [bacterium]|nr:hypothetical protein [bacterium]